MAYTTYPGSALPANIHRQRSWGSERIFYDSGAAQGASRYVRPLLTWDIPYKNISLIKQSSLEALFDVTLGGALPFLIKDAYEFRVNSVLAVRSGITNAATLYLYNVNSWFVRADTFTIGSLFSASSGFVTLGAEYSYAQDTGLLTVNTKATADVWGVRSMQYWRKAMFMDDYGDTGIIWEQFSLSQKVREIV
jgi:hypothetical protein